MNQESTGAPGGADRLAGWSRAGWAFIVLFAAASLFSISVAQVAAGGAGLCLLARWRAGGEAPSCSSLCVPLLAFAAISLVAAVFSMDPVVSLKDSKDLLHLAVFWVGYDFFRREPGRTGAMLRALAGAGGLAAAAGLVQAAQRGIDIDNRIRGFNDTYMTYGGLLSLAFVAGLAAILYDWRGRRDGWIPAAMALMALAIVLSLTRSAFLGGLAGSLALLIPRKPVIAMMAPVLLALVLALSPKSIFERFKTIFDATSAANTERVHVWRSGIKMALDHPFLGVGQNCFPKAYPEYRHPDVIEKEISHLHNNMLELAVERGIPAMLIWAAIWAVAYWALIRAWLAGGGSRGPDALGLAVGLGVATAFLTTGMFEYNFGDAEPQMLALLLLGAGMAAAERGQKPEDLHPA